MEWLVATLLLIALTFIPTLELRFSIPLGLLVSQVQLPFFGELQGFGLPWWYVFIVCVIANILLGPLWYWLLDSVILWIRHQWKWFDKTYKHHLEKKQEKIGPAVKKWGWLSLAIFIAIPLPGSGVYTGGLVAYALGMGQKRFFLATIIGVLIAGSLVTLLSLGILHLIF